MSGTFGTYPRKVRPEVLSLLDDYDIRGSCDRDPQVYATRPVVCGSFVEDPVNRYSHQ